MPGRCDLARDQRGVGHAGVDRDPPVAVARHEEAPERRQPGVDAREDVLRLRVPGPPQVGGQVTERGMEIVWLTAYCPDWAAVAGAKPWHYAGSVGPLRISDAVAAQLAKLGELLSERFKLTELGKRKF